MLLNAFSHVIVYNTHLIWHSKQPKMQGCIAGL